MNEIFSFHTLIRSFVRTKDLLTFTVEDHRVEIKANNNSSLLFLLLMLTATFTSISVHLEQMSSFLSLLAK